MRNAGIWIELTVIITFCNGHVGYLTEEKYSKRVEHSLS